MLFKDKTVIGFAVTRGVDGLCYSESYFSYEYIWTWIVHDRIFQGRM